MVTPKKKAPAKKKAAPAKKKAAPAKKAALVPKKSPLAGMTVDAFVERLPGWQRALVLRLRDLIHGASPAITSEIKWARPVFSANGPVAYVAAASQHVTLGFWRGAELPDPRGLLDAGGDRMRHMKLAEGAAVEESGISALVKQAVSLNRTQGDPTRRG